MAASRRFKIGQVIGLWTIQSHSGIHYTVQCTCGQTRKLTATKLATSKGCRRCITGTTIAVGDVFGPSTIIEEQPRSKWDRMFLVNCQCGSQHILPLKTIKYRKRCPDQPIEVTPDAPFLEQLRAEFPNISSNYKGSKIYELFIWLRREKDAQLCNEWKSSIVQFAYDFAELMGGTPEQYLVPRSAPVYYTLERLDKDGIWEKSNVTVRRFLTERAFHRKTYLYWRLLGQRGLLEDDLLDDYISFLNTFGEKQTGYVLRRRDRRRLHSSSNSFWVRYRRDPGASSGSPGGGAVSGAEGPIGLGGLPTPTG